MASPGGVLRTYRPAAGSAVGGNFLNQYGRIEPNPNTLSYDLNGNLSRDADPQRTVTYGYDGENRLVSAAGATLAYDAVGRLAAIARGGTTTQFLYDGDDAIGEYDAASGALVRRTVQGAGVNEPLVVDEGGVRTWLYGDERGSIVALANAGGTAGAPNVYGVYGEPGAGNAGRFGYTGQMWLSEIGLQYSKARMYSPLLGRFMQPDPIGEQGGMNLYAYALNDPVNGSDPDGLDPVRIGGTFTWLPSSCTICNAWATYNANTNEVVITAYRRSTTDLMRQQMLSSAWRSAVNSLNTLTAGAAARAAQRANPACTSGRYTLGGQFSATGFLASLGLSGNVEVGVALPTRPSSSWNPFAGVQVYARAQGLGLSGLGFFAGAGVSGVGGINDSPLTTGVQNSFVAQGGLAAPGGGEASVSLNGSGASVSGGPRAGMGGYLAGGAGKTATIATAPLGCPR